MRLTQKNEFFEYVLPCQNIVGDNQASEISLGETEYTCKKYIIGEAIKEFGELEDVLEKYKIENLEEYIKLHQIDNYAQDFINDLLEENKRVNVVINLIKQENNDLKNELAELKQKAIVPKFRIGQEV